MSQRTAYGDDSRAAGDVADLEARPLDPTRCRSVIGIEARIAPSPMVTW